MKIAETYFVPGGNIPQPLQNAADDRGLTIDHEVREPVAVMTWTATTANSEPYSGYLGIPKGEEWPVWGATASRRGVFSAATVIKSVALSGYHASWNKEVAIATLNTWFYVAVVGMDGCERKKFLLRHTLPSGQPAKWEVHETEKGRLFFKKVTK